jgi:hypothetical protein
MKTYKIFGIQIDLAFCLKISRVKRINIDIPDWADDCHLNISDSKPIIKYYKGTTPYFINIPKCKKAVQISRDKLYDRINGGYKQNRKIVIDLYLW